MEQRKMIALRDYQQDAVNAVYDYLHNRDGNPVVVVPTGGGKTPIIGQMCSDYANRWNGRIAIVSHVKELLEQSHDTLRAFDNSLDVGVYSAGLGSRETRNKIVIAGIQSVYNKAEIFGRFDLVIVDEAHLIPPDGDGMYQTFFKSVRESNSECRVVGMTATPYRMATGLIYGPQNILNEKCYEVSVKKLIGNGWLSPLTSKNGTHKTDFGSLKIRGGEFDAEDVSAVMNSISEVHSACYEIVKKTQDRKTVLVFACNVAHAEAVQKELSKLSGEEVGVVTGATHADVRQLILSRFRGDEIPKNLFGDVWSPLKYVVNVNVLTTGFDAPNIDAIALLRPTLSPGLYVQMVGRGLRKCDGKKDCLVLDYGENILRHGCIDNIIVKPKGASRCYAPVKTCPECQEVIPAREKRCKCGYVFVIGEGGQRDRKTYLGTTADGRAILSGEVTYEEKDVEETRYTYHEKKRRPGDTRYYPPTMEVEYVTGLASSVKEWVCPEHTGFAREKFARWWTQRSNLSPPRTTREAVDIAGGGNLAETTHIRIKKISGEKFDRVVSTTVGPKPSEYKGTRNEQFWNDF